MVAVELSPAAAAVAAANFERYGLRWRPQGEGGGYGPPARPSPPSAGLIELRLGSWGGPLRGEAGRYAGVVSNPPYIASAVMPSLQVGRPRTD